MILEKELEKIEKELAEVEGKITAGKRMTGPLASRTEFLTWQKKGLELGALEDPKQKIELDVAQAALDDVNQRTEKHKATLAELAAQRQAIFDQRRKITDMQAAEGARLAQLELAEAWLALFKAAQYATLVVDELPKMRRTDLVNGGEFWQETTRVISPNPLDVPLPKINPYDEKAKAWLANRIQQLKEFNPVFPENEGEKLVQPSRHMTSTRVTPG